MSTASNSCQDFYRVRVTISAPCMDASQVVEGMYLPKTKTADVAKVKRECVAHIERLIKWDSFPVPREVIKIDASVKVIHNNFVTMEGRS